MVLINSNLQELAIILRSQGLSYSEIQEVIPVSKSPLSLWTSHIKLSRRQKQRLLQKMIANNWTISGWITGICRQSGILQVE